MLGSVSPSGPAAFYPDVLIMDHHQWLILSSWFSVNPKSRLRQKICCYFCPSILFAQKKAFEDSLLLLTRLHRDHASNASIAKTTPIPTTPLETPISHNQPPSSYRKFPVISYTTFKPTPKPRHPPWPLRFPSSPPPSWPSASPPTPSRRSFLSPPLPPLPFSPLLLWLSSSVPIHHARCGHG